MKRTAAAMICLVLLGACGSDQPAPAEETVETTPDSGTETDPEDTETDSDVGGDDDETAADDSADDADAEEPSEEPSGDKGNATGGTFTGVAETGPAVTITAPEGWELYGADEAISEFDIVTAEKMDSAGGAQSVVVTDQNLGMGADEVFATMLETYRGNTETHSDVTVLDPITVDGVEFQGIEAVATLSSESLRIQYWFGEVDGAVLGIYVQHSDGTEEIPEQLVEIRDSITFD